MTFLSLIFICVGCHAQQLKINRKYITIKRLLDTKPDVHMIKVDPSINVFNDLFITYFYMHEISGTAIEDKP